MSLLLRLYDLADHPGSKDALRTLMRAAFDNSIVHSIVLDEYVEAIRQGQNPLEAARARLSDQRNPDP